MSADYFARLERGDGPQPSQSMLAAIARGLRLTPDERDHLFLLTGYRTVRRDLQVQHVSPGLMRVMDGLRDMPAQPGSPAADLVEFLRETNNEFARLWDRHEVGLRSSDTKRFVHPEIGRLDLYCQLLLEPDQGQALLIFTATPGTEDQQKLALLKVLGVEKFTVSLE